MSSPLRHPEGEQLLRYADGELPSRQARKIKSHLESCWQCRTELEEIQSVVRDSVRYRQDVLATHLPSPPRPWKDLTAGFDAIDDELVRRSLFAGLPAAKTWVPIAAAIAVAWIAYYQLRHTPSVEAAALLRKAVAAETAPSIQPSRIRIRTRRETVIRVAGIKSVETGPIVPLSARSFQQWRDQQSGKRDEVTTVAGNYQIRTACDSGDLAEATLQLRIADLHPVQERLQFRNADWVEIEEIGPEVAPPPGVVALREASGHTGLPAPSVSTNSNEFRQPAPAATVGDELSVLVALHQLGADLGDPIEVKRAGGRILVAGVGIDAQRRQQIEQALGSRATVDLRFSDPDASATPVEKLERAGTPPDIAATALQARLEKQVGGRGRFERLAADVLDASETMMSRAYALRRIAERFPRDVDAEMTASDRQILHNLYREHASALSRQAGEIERLLRPVLVPLGANTTVAPPSPSANWQAGTEELFTIARRAEALLAVMLGVAPGESGGGYLPTEVLSSLARLRVSAEVYGPAGSAVPRP
jgi:anti-sigma factor RsiW